MGVSGPEPLLPSGRAPVCPPPSCRPLWVAMTEPTDPARDEIELERYGADLVRAVDEGIVEWVLMTVTQVATAQLDTVPAGLAAQARIAGETVRAEVVPRMTALVSTDVDEQRSTPLSLVRDAQAHVTRVLREADVPPVARDPFDKELLTDDVYAVGPASFAEISFEAQDAAIRWGAAKAHVHRTRHRGVPR